MKTTVIVFALLAGALAAQDFDILIRNGKIVDGVHVFVGGCGGADAKAAVRILEDVPCDELPQVMERLVRFFPRADRPEPEAPTP